MLFGLKTFGQVVLFTVVETVVLAGWLALAQKGETILSIVVLAVGLLIEHILAARAGKQEGQ